MDDEQRRALLRPSVLRRLTKKYGSQYSEHRLKKLINKVPCTNRMNENDLYSLVIQNLAKIKESTRPQPKRRAHCILKHLFIGSVKTAQSEQFVWSKKITHMVTILTKDEQRHLELDPDIEQFVITERDGSDGAASLCDYLENAAYYIHTARTQEGNILVHCRLGQSRSATVVVAYLMLATDMNRDQALEYLKSHRQSVRPNSVFMFELESFQEDIEEKRRKFRECFPEGMYPSKEMDAEKVATQHTYLDEWSSSEDEDDY